jgi:hypothetical protein
MVIGVTNVLLGLIATSTRAFNEPVDTAGPLTVRIEGPEVVAAINVPQTIQVKLENRANVPLAGALAIGVIDHWRAEPTGAVPFSVKGKGKAQYTFRVTAGAGTVTALYPIHAWARFRCEAGELTAHPILVLQTQLPPPKAGLPWKPLEITAGASLKLWQTPIHRTTVAVFGQRPQVLPVGWLGTEPRTRAHCEIGPQTLSDGCRNAIHMTPPYAVGAGTIFTEYPVRLPRCKPLRLEWANAIADRPGGHSDGVTFRVRVAPLDAPEGSLGKIVWQEHLLDSRWRAAEVDLGGWAGKAVRLQLESHPGPKNNTAWDFSLWAEPTLTAGSPPAASVFAPKANSPSIELGQIHCGRVTYAVRLWPGRRGLLDAAVGFDDGPRRLCFQGFQICVLGTPLEDPRSPIRLRTATVETSKQGYQVRHQFRGSADAFDVVGHLYVEDNILRASFRLENGPSPQPWRVVRLEALAVGSWNQTARQIYAGVGNVVRDPLSFQLPFNGFHLPTSFVGFDFAAGPSLVQGSDVPPEMLDVRPAERHYSLQVPHAATLSFIPAPNVWEGVKLWRAGNGLHAADGVARAAGRFVFDLWYDRFPDGARRLQKAFQYGLTDSLVVWHNWQRWGVGDYRLPESWPPSPRYGTLAELQQLIGICKNVDVPFAPHDNYFDFYPDAAGFSYDHRIAFQARGEPRKGWLNKGRKAQAYVYRADQIEPFLQGNLKLVKENLAPTAYFIDVWSNVPPYDYWTVDGQFFSRVYTRDTIRREFAWIRDYLGGHAPQISESGHDQFIGWLDGGQVSHLRVGKRLPGKHGGLVLEIPCADAERIPWFDAAHHDRFVLQGEGYPFRYEGGLDPEEHGIFSDDYVAGEVLTGHSAMVPDAFDRDVVRKYWLLHGLSRALALRTIEQVEFVDGDLHRQRVQWSGGGQVWVNRGQKPWHVQGEDLPQYGFLARLPTAQGTVETSIAFREGLIVETARTADELYVNGRAMVRPRLPVRLCVEGIRRLEPWHYELNLRWKIDGPMPAGYRPFLYYVDGGGEVLSRVGLQPAEFAASRPGTITARAQLRIPDQHRNRHDFELRYEMRRSGDPLRPPLAGSVDGTPLIRAGTIHVEGPEEQGATWSDYHGPADPTAARQNPHAKTVDFGAVATAGGCRLSRQGQSLIITPLPQRSGTRLIARLRWDHLPWKLRWPQFIERLDAEGQVCRKEPLRKGADGVIAISIPAEEFAWRIGGP